MSEQTTTEQTNGNGNSKVWGVSVRAWLAIALALTVCVMSGLGLTIEEPLYSLAVVAVSFYFGAQKK